MYTIQRVIAHTENQWKALNPIDDDTSNFIVRFALQQRIYLLILENTDGNRFQINVKNIPNIGQSLDDGLVNLLFNLTSNTLESLAEPTIRDVDSIRKVEYHDIYDFGLSVQSDIILGLNSVRDPNQLPDLRVDFPNNPISPIAALNNYLFVVNGRLLQGEILDNTLFVRNGDTILQSSVRDRQMGVLDFSPVGGFVIERFTEDMFTDLTTTLSSNRFDSAVSFTLQTTTFTDHFTILVLDGHIVFDALSITSGTEASVKVSHVPSVARAQKPVSELPWIEGTSGYVLDTFDVHQYLLNTNSYLLHVPNTAIGTIVEELGRTNLEGRFTHYRVPQGVVVLEDGSIGHYKVVDYDEFTVALDCTIPKWNELLALTVNQDNQSVMMLEESNLVSTQGRARHFDWCVI